MSQQSSDGLERRNQVITARTERTTQAVHSIPLPAHVMSRSRLFDLIDMPFQAALTLITAPPGYGKSTLAASWAAQATHPVAWIELAAADNDPLTLERRIFAEIAFLLGDSRVLRVTPIGGEERTLAEQLAALSSPCTFVLDRCDSLHSSESIELLSNVLLGRSNPVRVIAISRSQTRLQCGSLRLMDQVRSIETTDLTFTEEETDQLRNRIGLVTTAHHLELHARTEGWPAGGTLGALAVRDSERRGLADEARHELIQSYVDDFVEQEIFLPLPEAHRIAALVGCLDPALVQACLESEESGPVHGPRYYLENDVRGLLAPATDQSGGVRLAPMLSASIARISRKYPHLVKRAAKLLISLGEFALAGELALVTHDEELIRSVGGRVGEELAIRSDLPRLAAFIARIPPEVRASDPRFSYWQLAAELLRGQTFTHIALQLDEFLIRYGEATDDLLCGRTQLLSGVRLYARGNDAKARMVLESALERLPQTALVDRLHVATFLELIAFRLGDDEAAEARQFEAIGYAFTLPIDELWSWRTTAPNRANAYALRGEIGSAISKYRLILAETPAYASPLEGFLRCRMISLLIERGDFDSAHAELETLQRTLEESDVEPEWRNELTLAQVRFLSATNRVEEAERIGNAALTRMRRRREKSQLVLLLARLWLDRGDRALVRSWLDDVRGFDYPAVQVFGEVNYRELELSLMLVERDFLPAASLARELVAEARGKRRVAEEIAYSMRLAVALYQLDARGEATEIATRAIDLAHEGGFLRSLAVPCFDVGALFPEAWKSSASGQRMRQKLLALAQSSADQGAGGLSRREREILQLVALGRSNQQIADGLFISVNTVRNHLVRVNHRLNVSSRSEAVARMRELDLID